MSKKTNLVVGAVATVAATSLLVGCNLYGKEKYTVTYMTNGGNAIAPSEYTWGDEIVLPSNPTKVGHTFKGWFFDANLTNPVTDKYVIEGDVVVYAKWEVNQYTVSFDSNGGTEIADFKANYGTSIKVNDPVRKGYEFLGWYIDEELESEFDLKVPGSNSTVYAKWKACKIEITFNMNASGVTGEMGKATYQTEDEKLTLDKSNYAREGYDFKGWSTTPDGAVEFEDGGDVTPLLEVSQTVTLYAVWEAKTHDLHFIHDGLAYGDDIKVAYNSSLVLPSTNPVKDGHVFLGWGTYGLTNDATFADNKVYYTYNSASKIYSVASIIVGATIPEETYYEAKLVSSTDVMPNSNLSLYSVWSINNYTINFDSKGGTAVDPITQAYGGAITLPTNITKVGYTFKGWYKDETYQTVFNSQTMPLNGATLYAKWEVNSYSIYFGSNLGSGTMAKMELTYEEEKTLSSNAFVRTGYTFVGWNTKEDGTGTSYTDGQKISKLLSEDEDSLTLYAQWEANTNTQYVVNHYTINLDGSISTNPYKVDTLEGTSDATVDVELLTIEGFVTPEAQTVTIAADGTTVLDVYYERQVYEVTFQAENPETEEVTTSSINVKFEGSITFSADYDVKNYSLVWKCNGEVVNSTTKVTSDMTLVAEYTRIEKTIVIHSEGQENVNISDVQAGAKVYELLEEPTKEGYTFEGWYLDNNFTTALPQDFEMPEDNVDIYVKWELKDVTISFDSAEGTTVSPITQKYDTAITLPTDVTREGYNFAGWYTKEGAAFILTTMPASNVELVAHWNPITYSVVFDANGGQGQTSSVEVNYGESRYLTENGFDRKGYKFLGWSTNKFAIDPEYENEAEIINLSLEDGAEVTLYAIWQIRQYEYKFVIVDDNGNQKEVLSSEVYNYDEAIVEPDPSKLEAYPVLYKFEGWHTDNKCTNDAIVDEKAYIEGEEVNDQILSITYYGKYTIGTYKVQFRNGNDGIIWETDSTGDTKDDLELVQTKFYGYVNSLGTRAKLFAEIYDALGKASEQDVANLTAILTYLDCFVKNDVEIAREVIKFNELPPNREEIKDAPMTQEDILMGNGVNPAYATKVVNLLYGTFDLTNVEDVAYITKLLTTGDILQKYKVGLAKFDEVLGALEAAIGPTSSYMSYYSAEYNKYKSNAFCPVREGYTFNGWNIIIDDETGIKIVDATWVKKLEVPVYLRVQSIGKNSVTYAWNAVEGAKDYTVYFVVKDAKGKVVDLTNEEKGITAVKDGENVIGNIVTTAYLGYEIGGLKDDYTVSVQVKANNPAGSTSNRIELPNGVTSDEEVVKVIESKEIDSDYTDEVSYEHEELGAVEISSVGDNYYQDKNNHVFYFFESTEYAFNNVTNIDVVVGSEYAKYEDGVLKINSNAVDHYIEIDIETSTGVTEYRAYIQPKIASIGLGSNLTSYMDVKEGKSQSKFLKTDNVDYLIGAASTSSTYNHNGYSYDYVTGIETKTYYNGFKFDIAINSTSGNVYTSSKFAKDRLQLAYTFFDSEDKEIEDTSSLFIKDGDVFYFLPTSGEYKVEVTYKVDGWYVTEDKEPVSGKIYRDGPSEDANDITPPPGGKFDSSRTYYEYYQSVGIPDKVKKEGLSKFKAEFTFKLDNSVNVYDNATLKSAFADPNVPAISIHGNIKSNLSTNQVVHVDYLKSLMEQEELTEDVYWSTDVPHISIKEGTAVFSSESSSMKLYKRGTGANSIKAKEGESYVSYVYCGADEGTHALVDAEWYNDYSGKAQFIVLNEDDNWNDGLYKQFGLDTAPIYQRESNNVSGGVKVNGNYFTLDASNIPYVVSKINRGQVDTTYHIQNSRIYLFLVASGNGTFNNLRIEGNTQNVTSNLGGATGTSLTIYQYMERTSGGLSGIKIERNEAEATTPTLYANNVVCEDVLIGVQGGHNTNISVDTTYINNTWSNSLYSYGGKEITIKDSKFTNSGGASMHITDLDIYDNNPTNDGNYVNPKVKLEGINFIENFISGEEPWFKQNNMEIAALNMKSKIESQVNMLTNRAYTVLKKDTDPVTGLKSEKMNLVMLGMPEHDAADGKDKVAPEDAYVNFLKTQGFFPHPSMEGIYLDASYNMYLMFVNEDLGFAIQGMIQLYEVAK